jgi:hypothetical protein
VRAATVRSGVAMTSCWPPLGPVVLLPGIADGWIIRREWGDAAQGVTSDCVDHGVKAVRGVRPELVQDTNVVVAGAPNAQTPVAQPR